MKKRSMSLFATAFVATLSTTAIMLCVSITGCQSGNQDATSGGEVNETTLLATEVVALTAPQQDAVDAFNRGDKKLLGVQTRGVSVPGVDEALLPVLRERYGVTLRHVTDVMKDQKDRDSITEVFKYVRQYNGKMAELLSAEL